MKIIGVIPARFESSRFPGKPLSDLLGRPMIWWVYQRVKEVKQLSGIYVATDDERIEHICRQYDMNVVMTSERHPTGVDRLAEVAEKIKADFYVLIQGDEPLIESRTIHEMVKRIEKNADRACVRTFKAPIKNPIDAVNSTVIKIVTDLNENVLLASRSPIPYPKAGIDFCYYKSVGVYAYPREILLQYPKMKKGDLEKAEDHDFMRMLENGIQMKAYEWNTSTISVDTPKDLERVRKIMEENNEFVINEQRNEKQHNCR